MNTIKKNRHLGALPRVRRRNSISKPASHVAHNAVQQRASLLKNNKSLAITLEETRCELSAYKSSFEESLEFMNKAKIAKSRMAQLSDAFKNFLKAFDENLALLDFDESKWLNIKLSLHKKFRSEMNPVLEVSNEVSEEVSVNQEMNCDVGSDCSDTAFVKATVKEKSDGDPKTVSKSPQKKTVENNNYSGPTSQTGDGEGNVNEATEVPKKIIDLNSLQKPLSVALSTEADKVTKIPRCQVLAVKLNRKHFEKEFLNSQNETLKRKLPEKVCGESASNLSRRKTFVVKNSNILTVTEHIKVSDEGESGTISERESNSSQDLLISKNDKRQTYVIKKREILKETEPAITVNDTRDKEFETENRFFIDETRDVHDGILKNNTRKTFVKKYPLHQNDVLEYQISNRNSDHVSGATENHENSCQSENFKSPNLQFNGEHSEQRKSISAEISKNIVHSTDVTSLNTNVTSSASSKKILSGLNITNGAEEISENTKSKIDLITVQAAIEVAEQNADVVNEGTVFTDNSPCSSFIQLSESEVKSIEDLSNFNKVKPALKTTPIRRQITKNKERKFVFDGKKRKTVARKKSQCEIINSEIGENGSHKNVEVCQSGVDAISNNENANKINNSDAMNIASEVVVNGNDLADIPFNACSVRKRSTKSSRKIKNNSTCAKNNAIKKASSKVQRDKKKKKSSADIQVDDLILKSKKSKIKRNANKKKNTDSCFDDSAIAKFVDINNAARVNKVEGDEKQLIKSADFPCEKTGENTFLVRAEIHPPPSSLNGPSIEKLNMGNEILNLDHMQVTVVLDDILKSKNIEHLNIIDKSLLCGKTVYLKSPLSATSSNFAIDPEESIEKLRCDPAHYMDDCDLHIVDEFLDIADSDVQIVSAPDIENQRSRRRKEVNYKEKPLNRKMRRCGTDVCEIYTRK